MASDRAGAMASFRDPGGRLAVIGDRAIRCVSAAGIETFAAFEGSRAVAARQAAGSVIGTRRLAAADAANLVPTFDRADGVLVEHDLIEFPSYPYEWPPEMLFEAGRLTLALARELLDEGLGLKDATPFNVLFRGPRAVFVDALSVEPRADGDPLWRPEAQFIRTFLLPLAAGRLIGLGLDRIFLTRRDGLDPAEFLRMCPLARRLFPPVLGMATVPVLLSRLATGKDIYKDVRLDDAARAEFVVRATLRRLERRLSGLCPDSGRVSAWSDYATRSHYPPQAWQRKCTVVEAAIRSAAPERVLDLGCNDGHFSLMAAATGARVVAVDRDEALVGRLWRRAHDADADVLPLVVDIAAPSPATGWRSGERPSFAGRAAGTFDLTLLLALAHHLAIDERIPLDEIASVTAETTGRLAIVEYVGPADPMFRTLLKGRGALFRDYTFEAFAAAFAHHFELVRNEPLPGLDRRVLVLEKRRPT